MPPPTKPLGAANGPRPLTPAERGLRAVLRLQLATALALCAPVVAGTAWYGWSAYVRFDRYRRAAGAKIGLDAELYQILLHDELDRHLRRLRMDPPPDPSSLPRLELWIPPEGMAALEADDAPGRKRRSVPGKLRVDGEVRSVSVRRQGRRHWHGLGVQKSLKLRARRGELVRGVRVVNLLNDVTPFGLEEELIRDLAREAGLLAPEHHPVRVRFDNADLGVMRFDAQPDEGLLRRQDRMPGSMYSGSWAPCAEGAGVGTAARVEETAPAEGEDAEEAEDEGPRVRADAAPIPCGWSKVAAAGAADHDRAEELARFLDALARGSHAELAAFAAAHLDLDRFARLEALDIAFGGDQHDARSNHKLFFDPYRGRFEPIALDLRAFSHEPRYALASSPLTLRLGALPDYGWRRDRAVHALLTGPATSEAIRDRVDLAFDRLRPELETDPYWDAYKLLPRASRFHRQLVRPMSVSRWLVATRAELETYARRRRFLLDRLEARALDLRLLRTPEGARILATVDGHGAFRWRRVSVRAEGPSRFELRAEPALGAADDEAPVASGEAGATMAPEGRTAWLAGARWRARAGGELEAVPVARRYAYPLRWTGAAPTAVELELEDAVTGATTRLELPLPTTATTAPVLADVGPDAAEVPRLVDGAESPHPWRFPREPSPRTLVLGPGRVERPEGLRVARHETLVLEAGTELLLGPAASVLAEGRVEIRGRPDRPVRIARLDPSRAFGGVVLVGEGARGSRIEHLRLEGASSADAGLLHAPGSLAIQDTADVRLADVELVGCSGDDLLRATYVRGLELHEVSVREAPNDAVDLEHVEGEVRGLSVIGARDECLDLMGVRLRMSDSLLVDCGGNAISAGERSRLEVSGTAISGARVGVLAKNASEVRVSRGLIHRTEQALRTRRRDVHYDAPSVLRTDELHIVEAGDVQRRGRRTRLETSRTRTRLPTNGQLHHLASQVLGLSDWSELEARLDALRGRRP